MRTFSKWFVVALFGAMLGLAGCDQKDPMEKAGEKVDNAVDEMSTDGPMENAGEEADQAWDNTKEGVNDAADSMGDAVDGNNQ